jgi:glyoxylase-like metal-dependent hydrolase (beta-lactamase superfamily II)
MACANGTGRVDAGDRAAFAAQVRVAEGVYVLQGAGAPEQGNIGFVIGPRGVVVIDSGGSAGRGDAALAAIAKLTTAPVRLLVLTHPTQEHIFGAAPFKDRGIPVLMHSRAAALMASRCATCLERLRRDFGEPRFAGTRVIVPDRLIETSVVIQDAGRPLRVFASDWSSAPGALAVLDEASGTLFTGDHVAVGRVPDLRDADPPGWHAALLTLAATPCARLVPGRGAPTDCGAIARFDRYLVALDELVSRRLREGLSLAELPAASELPEFARWADYDTLHRANAQRQYLRRERELFD